MSNREANLERISSLIEAMRRDSVDAVIDEDGKLKLEGTHADVWSNIIEKDRSLITNFVSGLPLDCSVTSPTDRIRRLMATYGIKDSWSSKELNSAKIDTKYLVKDCLVANQHCVLAGPSKSMKTSTAIDLALSLSHPSMFLGKFWVPAPQRVLFLSAESGEGAIQETARRVASSKGFSLEDDTGVSWNFWFPGQRTLSNCKYLIISSIKRVQRC